MKQRVCGELAGASSLSNDTLNLRQPGAAGAIAREIGFRFDKQEPKRPIAGSEQFFTCAHRRRDTRHGFRQAHQAIRVVPAQSEVSRRK